MENTIRRAGCLGVLVLLISAAAHPGRSFGQELPDALADTFRQGVAAQKAGRLDEAEKDFLQVLRAGGKAAFVYNNLGIVYQQRGDHGRAIAQFREAIRLDPNYAAPRILLGASLLALGKVPEATRELEEAVKLQPREPLARVQLARAYDRGNNLGAVVDQYRALRGLAPQDPEYAYQLGQAYLRLAAWCFQEIRRVDPHGARAYQVQAESYRNQGFTDGAIRAYQLAAQADPRLPGIHLSLAGIYLEQGRIEHARQEIQKELALVPESVAAKALQQKIESRPSQP